MSVKRISERYAKMLVDTATEQDNIDTLIEDASVLNKALETRDLLLMYKSPVISTGKKQEITKQLFSNNISELFLKFLDLTISKGREKYLPEIMNAVNSQTDAIKGITRITIVTATKVSDKIIEDIKNVVKEKTGSQDSLIVTHQIDPEIIGGYKVIFDGKILDATIKNKLNKLKKSFIPAFN